VTIGEETIIRKVSSLMKEKRHKDDQEDNKNGITPYLLDKGSLLTIFGLA